MKKFYVYILRCADQTYYTGVTSNLTNRIKQHTEGKYQDSYTFFRRPITLVYFSEFTCIKTAIEKEKQIKKWSKAKKEAFVNANYCLLPSLAKKKFH